MTDIPRDRRAAFRVAIDGFLQERRDAKLEKLSEDDPKRQEIFLKWQPQTWLAEAAGRRVAWIQKVTHPIKATYPDAKIEETTSLCCELSELPKRSEVGSHSLSSFADDASGNAAALDIFAFLTDCMVEGKPLLYWMKFGDPDLLAELDNDSVKAKEWMKCFANITVPRSALASHTAAKQLFWLVGDDPSVDGHFQLLAPLFSSPLAHYIFKVINEDRFGEAAKLARAARRGLKNHENGYSEYVDLAIQKIGGTNPQNISQLNGSRRGSNYLLASLPPLWRESMSVRPKAGQSSMFDSWGKQIDVWLSQKELREFLSYGAEKDMATRDERDFIVAKLIDLLLMLVAPLHALPAGWSTEPGCDLNRDEQLWLDPFRFETDLEFRHEWASGEWVGNICDRFGAWVNSELRKSKKLPVGDDEHRYLASELASNADWLFELGQLKKHLSAIEKRESKAGSAA